MFEILVCLGSLLFSLVVSIGTAQIAYGFAVDDVWPVAALLAMSALFAPAAMVVAALRPEHAIHLGRSREVRVLFFGAYWAILPAMFLVLVMAVMFPY